MEISVVREQYRPGSTIGRLSVDGVFECFTLEDGIRTNKVHGETAIPNGIYEVAVNYSPRFKVRLPIVRNVPKFDGVRIHPGNSPANTLGCILVGRSWTVGTENITASRVAFKALMTKIEKAIAGGEKVRLQVVQENAPVDLATRALRHRNFSSGHATQENSERGRSRASKAKSRVPRTFKRKTRRGKV